MQHKPRRYAFQCLNPDCRRNQTRWIRRGEVVSCGACGAMNPGPAMLRRMFPWVQAPEPAPPAVVEIACSA